MTWTSLVPGNPTPFYAALNPYQEKFAACVGNCDTPEALWDTVVIETETNPVVGTSAVALPGGEGFAVAYTVGQNGGNRNGVVHYTECASDCADDAGLWVDVVVDAILGGAYPPELVVTPEGVRGLAFAPNGQGQRSDLYAECSGDCTSASSWAEGAPNSNVSNPQSRPGLALLDLADGGLLRMLSDGQSYFECSSACTGAATISGWSAGMSLPKNINNGDQVLLVGPENRPRLAALSCQLFYEDCTAEPCTTATNWSSASISSQVQCNSKVDYVQQSDGTGEIVYQSSGGPTGNALSLAVQSSAGWTSTPITVCGGAAVQGDFPSMVLGSDGLPQIYFGDNAPGDFADGGAVLGHYLYSTQH